MAEIATKENNKISFRERFAAAFTKENIAKVIFVAFAAFSILAVFAIIFYILYDSIPAFREIGFFNFIFGDIWNPNAGEYGILPMILTTLLLTVLSVVIGSVFAVFTAVFIVYYCPKCIKKVYTQMVNLLAGIPSIIYAYFGFEMIKPIIEDMSGRTFGYGILLSTIILSIMILPTIASISKNSLENVPAQYYEGSLALGNTKNQTVFKVMLPAAKNGILAAIILGIGRAVGETMAVQFLLGGAVSYPTDFIIPISSLTSKIAQEFGESGGLHRQALIAIGFVLLVFILIINLVLWFVKRNNAIAGNSVFTRKIKESDIEHTAPNYKRTGTVQDALRIVCYVIAAIVGVALLSIVLYTLIKGLPEVTWHNMFGKSLNSAPTLAPAFVSTIAIIIVSLAIALPLGIGAAIYLNEYSRRGSKFVNTLRLFIDTLAGVPSILFGLFGYIFFVRLFGSANLLAGSFTIVLMILPTIIRSTEQSLSEVPDSMREASYALGAGKLRTVFVVVLPQALPGIITAIILSIGRIVGESAALIYTAGSSFLMPTSLLSPGSTFAVFMYNLQSEGLDTKYLAYAAGAILIIFVLFLNILIMLLENYFNNKAANKKGAIRTFIDKLRKKEVKDAQN